MFVSIRSYASVKQAGYLKYRLEQAGIQCKIELSPASGAESKEKYDVQVVAEQCEKAVDVFLKTYNEYPNEDFELQRSPGEVLRILIPLDFCDKSLEAAKYAIDIASQRPVEVNFLYVWDDELDASIAMRTAVEEIQRMQRHEISQKISIQLNAFIEKIEKLIAQCKVPENLLYYFTGAEGKLINQISKTIGAFNPQLIIAAHNNDRDWQFRISREKVFGMVDLGACPVFYIPQKVFYSPIHELHIMYATNFDENDLPSFKLLQNLALGYETTIHIMHVTQEGSNSAAKQNMDQLVTEIEKAKEPKFNITSDIFEDSNLVNGFSAYIKEKNIEMIAFTSPEYGILHKLFNPDNLTKIMKGSTLPLLIFRHK